jgi:hypothetical protein
LETRVRARERSRGLSLNVGLENEYISSSPFPTAKNDLKYIATLAYDL